MTTPSAQTVTAEVWQTVPLPSTPEMNAAGERIDAEMRAQGFAGAEPEAIYYAMLDAAPYPPSSLAAADARGKRLEELLFAARAELRMWSQPASRGQVIAAQIDAALSQTEEGR